MKRMRWFLYGYARAWRYYLSPKHHKRFDGHPTIKASWRWSRLANA